MPPISPAICARELGTPSHISLRLGTGDRAMRIGTFPVGIETRDFTRLARRAVKTALVQRVAHSVPGVLMIGVDRLDYSKGITPRLEAYERFLAAHPQWRGKITYLQITPKSRSQIKEYAEMEAAVNSAAGRINGTYSEANWSPVRYVNRPYSRTALAGMYRAARVGLVTPMRDGMNPVAKEYVAAQDPDDPGVLILSRFAGAADEFREALLVNPYDPDAVAAAIARAVAMPLPSARRAIAELYAALLRSDISKWGDKFLKALGPQDRKHEEALRSFVAGPRQSRGCNWPSAPASSTTMTPMASSRHGVAGDAALRVSRHPFEAVGRGQPQHRRHQRQLGAQHGQIDAAMALPWPPSRIEAASISPVMTRSSTATIAPSENSDSASTRLGSLRAEQGGQDRPGRRSRSRPSTDAWRPGWCRWR